MPTCPCAGAVHQSCDPSWPKNLTDEQLLHTYDTIIDHEVTGVFADALATEMKNRGLSCRRWVLAAEDDED